VEPALNTTISNFVDETKRRYGSVRRHWRKDLFPDLNSRDWLDGAILAGTSVADLVDEIRRGALAEKDIPSEVLKAFHLQFPNVGDFTNFVKAHDDPDQLRGIFSGLKGKLFELRHLDYLNDGHLPDGFIARLADSPVQPAHDIIIEGPDHEVAAVLQDKATASLSILKTALERYPDIDIYVPSEVAEQLQHSDLAGHVFDSGVDGADIEAKVQTALDAANQAVEYHFPWLSEIVIVFSELNDARRGKTTIRNCGRRMWRRGSRLFSADLVGNAAAMASGHPVLSMLRIPARFLISRWDVSRDFSKSTGQRLARIRRVAALFEQRGDHRELRALTASMVALGPTSATYVGGGERIA